VHFVTMVHFVRCCPTDNHCPSAGHKTLLYHARLALSSHASVGAHPPSCQPLRSFARHPLPVNGHKNKSYHTLFHPSNLSSMKLYQLSSTQARGSQGPVISHNAT